MQGEVQEEGQRGVVPADELHRPPGEQVAGVVCVVPLPRAVEPDSGRVGHMRSVVASEAQVDGVRGGRALARGPRP